MDIVIWVQKKPRRISWQTEYIKDKEDFKILEGLIKYVNRDPVWNTARGLDLKKNEDSGLALGNIWV